ncbi:MAG: L17 family ribosomal protein [Pseudomonadota bacterium]
MIKSKIKSFKIHNLLYSLLKYRCIETTKPKARLLSSYASRFISRCLKFERQLALISTSKTDKDTKETLRVSDVDAKISEKNKPDNNVYVCYKRYINSQGLAELFEIIRDINKSLLDKNISSGYFQTIKTRQRPGDNALMAIIKFAKLEIYEREKTQDKSSDVVSSRKQNARKGKFKSDNKSKNNQVTSKSDKKGQRIHRTQSR